MSVKIRSFLFTYYSECTFCLLSSVCHSQTIYGQIEAKLFSYFQKNMKEMILENVLLSLVSKTKLEALEKSFLDHPNIIKYAQLNLCSKKLK